MGRQLFLHHYLPAHLSSALVAGALLEFVFNLDPAVMDDAIDGKVKAVPANKKGEKRRSFPVKGSMSKQNMLALWGAAGVVMAVVVGGWYFFLPLTYGKPGLSAEEVVRRKWLGYDLHFAK